MDDYVDDLELLEEYDLEHDSDDSRSEGERRPHDGASSEDEGVDLETAMAEIKTTVVEVVSALGGIEENQDEQGNIQSIYVVGDDCLSK